MADFVKVAKTAEIVPGQGKMIEVGGKKIALFNVEGSFHAIDDTCTHRGGPLSEGSLDGKEDSAEKPSVHPSRTSGRTEEQLKSL